MDEKKMTGLLIGMQKSLFNFAYSLTMNRDDAQDLLQATSLKVLSNVEKLVHYENLNGWMYTIMRNIFINDYHRNVNRRTVYDNEDETIMKSVANDPSDDTPESLYNVKVHIPADTRSAFPVISVQSPVSIQCCWQS